MSKPTLPQGTRDFPAVVVRKRNYILNTIKSVFELYGYHPLETPAFENLETLMGKYGEEGDKLIFKILNNGLADPKHIEKAKEGFEKILQGKNSTSITERALKYDLTIPFARYVAMNQGQLSFPFKRYQIQPVWRADRPQKGRYREFTQCDADVVGSDSLYNEVSLAGIYHDVFCKLGLTNYRLAINSRKILTALAEKCDALEKLTDITISIDKLDKIGINKVSEELSNRGLTNNQISIIQSYLQIKGNNESCFEEVKKLLGDTEAGASGLNEIEFLIAHGNEFNLQLDLTLARGLNYYTGIIFEVKPPDGVKMGSIGGGGRYDDLTGLFGVPGIPGVGISFGVDRIFDVLEELNLFPEGLMKGTPVLFINLGDDEADECLKLMNKLRLSGIACDLYPDKSKLDRQFKYADKNQFSYCIIIGSNELNDTTVTLKDLSTGNQETIKQEKLISYLQPLLKSKSS